MPQVPLFALHMKTVCRSCVKKATQGHTNFNNATLAQGIPRAAMSPAASGGRTVEPVTEEDF
jgi:hypothetical protein